MIYINHHLAVLPGSKARGFFVAEQNVFFDSMTDSWNKQAYVQVFYFK